MIAIHLIGMTVTAFAVFFLLLKKIKAKPIKFAVAILILWFVRFVFYYLINAVDLTVYPQVAVLDFNLLFLDGVFLFWLTKSINNQVFVFKKEFWHLLPFIFYAYTRYDLLANLSTQELADKIIGINQQIEDPNSFASYKDVFIAAFVVLQNLVYGLLSIKKLKKYKKHIKTEFSNIDKISLNWLNYVITAWFIFFIFPITLFYITYFTKIFDINVIGNVMFVSLCIIAIVFSIKSLIQKYAVFIMPSPISPIDISLTKKKNKVKYIKSGMSQSEIDNIFNNVSETMNLQKIFQEPNLTLGKLAEEVQVSPNKLSQVINTKTDGNFYDFINTYRVNAVKEDLLIKNDPVMIIAYYHGFNSKSTFNEVFKKNTGQTPTQFRKALKSA